MLNGILHKKLKASTLVEALVASVIIVLIFAIASMTLNNVFQSSIQGNAYGIDTRLHKLMYLYQHDKINYDYQESFMDYEISFSRSLENGVTYITMEAEKRNPSNQGNSKKKTITKKIIDTNYE